MKSVSIVLCLVMALLATATGLPAQVLAALQGTVCDKAGKAPLAGVKVTIVAEQTGAQTELQSDAKGSFYRSGLQPGVYRISLDKSGYLPGVIAIRLTIGETSRIAVELESATLLAAPTQSLLDQGLEQLKAGRFGEAAQTFSQALQADPSSFVLLYYRGFAYEKSKDYDRALADYGKAAGLKADFMLPLAAIGNILAKKSEYAKAVEFYRKAESAGTPDLVSLYNYGVCLINTNSGPEAARVLERLLAIDPSYADAWYQLGLIELGRGDLAKAKERLKGYLQLDPQGANAATVGEILKSLN